MVNSANFLFLFNSLLPCSAKKNSHGYFLVLPVLSRRLRCSFFSNWLFDKFLEHAKRGRHKHFRICLLEKKKIWVCKNSASQNISTRDVKPILRQTKGSLENLKILCNQQSTVESAPKDTKMHFSKNIQLSKPTSNSKKTQQHAEF